MKGAKQRVLIYASKEDGTYDTRTGKPISYGGGFQVSFVRPEAFEKLSDDDWDLLTAHIMERMGSIEHIGVYDGAAETSFHVDTQDDAEKLMYLFNQDSVLIWANKKKYPDDPAEWFIWNKLPDAQRGKEVDYDAIMRKIRKGGK